MPIELEDGFYMTHDLTHVSCIGVESTKLDQCIARAERDRIAGVFGHEGVGFTGQDLDFLSRLPWVEAVWFWDVRLRSVDGLYALTGLQHFGIHPVRPAIDFSRFPRLRHAVVEPKARDHGLDSCSELKLLDVWRHPPKGRDFSIAIPTSVEELGLFWSSLASLDSLPQLPRLRKLKVARCRNLESLGDLGSKFPSLEHLVVSACGRVKDGEGERVARDLPQLSHAWVREAKVVQNQPGRRPVAELYPQVVEELMNRVTRKPAVSSLVDAVAKLDPAMDDALRSEVEATLDRLLYGEREYWECWLERIITGRELCNVLLAHVQTTIGHHTGHMPSVEALEVIAPDFEIVLFGSRLPAEEPAGQTWGI